MSSPPRTTGGRRMMGGVLIGAPGRRCRTTSERGASLAGCPSLPSVPSHYAHSSARSVVTGSQRLGRFLTLIFGGIRDVGNGKNFDSFESGPCAASAVCPERLVPSTFRQECFVPLDFPRRCPLPLFPKRPCGRPG